MTLPDARGIDRLFGLFVRRGHRRKGVAKMVRMIVLLTAVLLALAACAPRDVAPTASGPQEARGIEMNRAHVGAATASIEERIWLADVVVRANLQSSAAGLLTFGAVEYLKGAGPSTFTVIAETDGRPTTWDGQEAVLFLNTAASSRSESKATSYAFTDTTTWSYVPGPEDSYTGTLPAGYTVDSRNPVWVPLSSGGAGGGRGDSGGGESLDLDDLRATIAWLGGSGPRLSGLRPVCAVAHTTLSRLGGLLRTGSPSGARWHDPLRDRRGRRASILKDSAAFCVHGLPRQMD